MTIDRNTLLFFDASCLIAAAGIPTGGSGFLLSLCASGFLKAAVSQPVLFEAQGNIQEKRGDEAMRRLFNLLVVVPFSIASLPDTVKLDWLEKHINKKDAHVVAAALEAHAPFLLALDRGFVLEVNKADLGIQALSPGEFIKTILASHTDISRESDWRIDSQVFKSGKITRDT
jgi:predicted nucleic acid-binding protein